MKAMILAAGRGDRLRPLTDNIPKPLIEVGGRPLIVHLVERLAKAGLKQLVINYAHLGEQLVARLGDGGEFNVRIQYSPEPAAALETGGGIRHALPLLGDEPFAVVNSDIWTDYPFERLPPQPRGLAHLVLVDNPAYHPKGDFTLVGTCVRSSGAVKLTFAGIGVYTPELFRECRPGRFPLAPLLHTAAERGVVSGEHYDGVWADIGTVARWRALNARLGTPSAS